MVADDVQSKVSLVKYYAPNNSLDFKKILSIPVKDRLPELTKKVGFKQIGAVLMAEITKFQNCYNVIRPMNIDQIAQCAYSIIQTAEEDQLSLEDVVLFLEGAKQGKYGKVYDRLDQQVIFEMLEVYRNERHRSFMDYKLEQHEQHKADPINNRFVSDAADAEQNKFSAAMSEYMKLKYTPK